MTREHSSVSKVIGDAGKAGRLKPRRSPMAFRALAVLLLMLGSGCASLGLALIPPRFALASGERSEIRLLGPSLERPLGGASVRLYARVENPNPIGITLTRLVGTLQIEGFDAADADLPLGLPLGANQASVVPIDISFGFQQIPALAEVLSRAVSAGNVAYSLRGRVTVDAGSLGQPTFGPTTFLQGNIDVRR